MGVDFRSPGTSLTKIDSLQAFENFQDKLILCLSAIGLPAILLATARATEFGWRHGLSAQVAAWGGVVLLLLFRGRLSFRARSYGFIIFMMLYAAAGVMTWGMSGQGLLLLFALVVMATLVDGPRAGLATTLMSLTITSVAGTGFVAGWLSLDLQAQPYNRSLVGWASAVATSAALMLAAVWSLGRLKSSWLAMIEDLRAREAEYASILRFTPDIIYRLGVDNRITFISNAVKRYGYDPADLMGRPLLDFVHPEDKAAVAHRLQERRTGRRRTHNMEVRLFAPPAVVDQPPSQDTLTQPVFLISAEGLYESGRALSAYYQGTQGVARDITAYKTMHRELQELQQKLERARKMEALGLLAGGVAHDLNNILSGIVSYPSLMLMKLPEDSPLRRNLCRMKASGEKAAEIVQDLLTLARRGVKVKEVLNINQIIREHLESAEYLDLRKRHPGVRLATRLAPDLLPIEGSPLHLKKALMNLVSNAFEAQPHGGSVLLQTQNAGIDPSSEGSDAIAGGEFVVMRVADQGRGMTSEEVERIFEPFYTRKAMGRSGTGLGLAVVWGTVQDHQGTIQVDSAPGKGTRFDLYFPATRGCAVTTPPKPEMAALKGNGQTILVVDDDRGQGAIAVEILETLSYQASAVVSGEAALAYLDARAVDLLVLDMIMPGGMNGLETYRAVLKRQPRQKALLVSGLAEADRVEEAMRLGAADLVRKPYTVETLAEAVRIALNDATGRDAHSVGAE